MRSQDAQVGGGWKIVDIPLMNKTLYLYPHYVNAESRDSCKALVIYAANSIHVG